MKLAETHLRAVEDRLRGREMVSVYDRPATDSKEK